MTIKKSSETWYQSAVGTAGVAGVLVVMVCALLAYDYHQRFKKDPLEQTTYKALEKAVAQQPENETLKEELRVVDRELRREYFRQRTFVAYGSVLLLIFTAIFFASTKWAATLRRQLPEPDATSPPPDHEKQRAKITQGAVLGFSCVLILLVIYLNASFKSVIPPSKEQSAPANAAAPSVKGESGEKTASVSEKSDAASAEEYAKAWPRFRGPNGTGISAYKNIPLQWNAAEGKNIRWQTPVPLPGNNSPVVWKNRVFLSGADEKSEEVYCFDAENGKLLWQKTVTSATASKREPPKVMEDTGYAASTPATDGSRVFAIFATGDLAAFDFEGKLLWSKSLGPLDNGYGHAASLLVYKNRLIVPLDQGGGKRPKSKLYAFDAATGEKAWQADRALPSSWSTPIVVHAAERDQIITAADPFVIAYDAKDGKEIWKVKCLINDVGPSPTAVGDTVFMANDGTMLSAIRANGEGDVTEKNILWRGEDGMPDTCSVLADERFVLILDASGVMNCYDAKKGDNLWSEDFGEPCHSSPSFADGKIYVFAKSGKCWVVEPTAEKANRLFENELGEECVTCPAFQDGCFYIRTKEKLICVGNKGIGD